MKTLSFYQYTQTLRGQKNEEGVFAEAVYQDLMFPKSATSFHELSDYIENYGPSELSLSLFDTLYERYTEWLKF
ncbi:YozE family protein [Macrococcus sp. DPC7161]|uniref:YozE family protein n=1 Tax=Macrococcus sp. DPC7161 TaxID=2507060 RepID=UPI00100B9153|nr:YozE family protein [Macrococcus sp. DPC7161]RXK19229.1 YozE family protein [Macrococcus sp. DPC7161]